MKVYDYDKFFARAGALSSALMALGMFARVFVVSGGTAKVGAFLIATALVALSYGLATYRTERGWVR